MNIYYTREELQKKLHSNSLDSSVGFVPTMGALHEGHLSLVEKALEENNIVVVSIFVNPTQFDNEEDLKKYPNTIDQDVALLESVNENILVFAPDPTEIYGKEIVSKKYDFGKRSKKMEGKYRKGHFDGVGTVLTHLFRIVEPDRAYFGEKDFQQLQIVKKLVVLENMPVQIVGCPIIRERNGLAMSSRNKRLTEDQFKEAAFIYETLLEVRARFKDSTIEYLKSYVTEEFNKNSAVTLEYFEIANIKNMMPADAKEEGKTYRAFIAAFVGEIRLIDNIDLN